MDNFLFFASKYSTIALKSFISETAEFRDLAKIAQKCLVAIENRYIFVQTGSL
jgi:hypothetical protein